MKRDQLLSADLLAALPITDAEHVADEINAMRRAHGIIDNNRQIRKRRRISKL